MEFSYEVRVPKDRVAVLIGVKGESKRQLEKLFSAKMDVDSHDNVVTVTGQDSIKLFTLKEVIRAIARGFNPEKAEMLQSQDNCLEVLNITDFVGEQHLNRVRGRVIGSDGKARENLERLTGTSISVYGKTVAILGNVEDVNICKRAIEALLGGRMHATVYKWLERNRRKDVF